MEASLETLEKRFLLRVNLEGITSLHQCWEWTGAKNSNGRAQIALNRRAVYAHRVAYHLYRDKDFPIISDNNSIFLKHYYCHNRGCMNPFHLEVTIRTRKPKPKRKIYKRKWVLK